MNKKLITISIIIIVSITGIIYLRNYTSSQKQENTPTLNEVAQPTPQLEEANETTDFTATFEIYTHGTRRIFTASMYHDQSQDVFITNPNPNVVNVKKAEVTWNDFFKTLPFSLTKECLVTGNNETYCTNNAAKLSFYINDEETPDALERPIYPSDKLVVLYGE